MKKLFVLLITFMVSFQVFGTNTDTVAVVRFDSLQLFLDSLNITIDSLESNLDEIDNIADIFDNGKDVIDYTVKVVGDLAYVIRNAPTPKDAESISWWSRFLQWSVPGLLALLTTIITAVFRLIRKDPDSAVNFFQKIIAKIRTRWFVIAIGAVLTIVSLFITSEGSWTWQQAIVYFLNAVLGGVGIHNIIQWIGDLFKKKEPEA